MYIEKLSIASFGTLKNKEYIFSDGFNIIEGNNESGKTTLMNFVSFILYGVDASLNKRMKASGEQYSGKITLFCEKLGKITISRVASCFGARSSDEISITSCDTLKEINIGKATPGEYILGINRDFFENTVFVSQNGASDYNSETASSAVQNILNSANEKMSTDRGKRKLDETRKNLKHKNNKGGAIYTISSEISELEVELERSNNGHALLKEAEKRITLLQKEAAALDETPKLIAEEKSARGAKKLQKLTQDKAVLLNDKIVAEDELKGLTDSNYSYRQANVISEIRKLDVESKIIQSRAEILEVTIQNSELELERMSKSSKLIPQKADDYVSNIQNITFSLKKLLFTAITIFSITAITVILGIVSIFYAEIIAACSILLSAMLSLVIGFVTLSYRKNKLNTLSTELSTFAFSPDMTLREISDEIARRRQFELLKELKSDEIAQSKIKLAFENESYEKSERLLKGLLFAIVPEHALLNTDEQIIRAEEKITQSFDDEAAIQRKIHEITSKIAELDREIGIYSAYSDIDTACNPTFASLSDAELDSRLHSIIERKREISEEMQALTVQITALENRLRSEKEIESEISEKKEILKTREEQFKIVLLAQDALDKASSNIRSAVTPNIIKLCDAMFNEITHGKYDHIGLDTTLSLNGASGEEEKAINELSYGTNEAMYLAFRISLCTVLCQKEMPPIMLDETFAHIDDGRSLAIIKMLSDLNAQTILFTCSSREAQIAAKSDLNHNVLSV